MTGTCHLTESQRLMLALFALLQSLDQRFEANLVQAREQLQQLQGKMEELLSAWEEREAPARLRQKMSLLVAAIRQHAPRTPSLGSWKEEWQAFRRRVQQPYEAAVAALRLHRRLVPSLRPRNLRRTCFHVSAGVVCLLLIQHLLTPMSMVVVPVICAMIAWTLEFLRRRYVGLNQTLMGWFGPLAHPHETERINSATWYTSALGLLGLTVGPLAGSLAVVVLAVGDPAASEIGRRFGRIRIAKRRTLEGCLAFVGAGLLASFCVFQLYYPELSFGAQWALALGGVIPGALAGLFSRRLDDNFSVPVAVAAGVAAVAWLLAS